MTDAEKNKAKGQHDKVKGEAKDAFGKLTNDKRKQASGKFDKAKGEVKKKVGELEEKNDDNVER